MPQLLGVSHMGYIYLGVTLISFSLLVTAYFNHWLQYGGLLPFSFLFLAFFFFYVNMWFHISTFFFSLGIPALLFLTLDGWVFVSYGLISLGFFSLFGVSERVLGKCDALGIPGFCCFCCFVFCWGGRRKWREKRQSTVSHISYTFSPRMVLVFVLALVGACEYLLARGLCCTKCSRGEDFE